MYCFAPDQLAQLATLSYKLKKEKREAKKLESTPSKYTTLVDPASVSVIGAVSDTGAVSSPPTAVSEKKAKKEKPSTSKVKKSESTRPQIVDLRIWIRSSPTISTA